MQPQHGQPIRLPSTVTAEQAGFPFRRLAEDEGGGEPPFPLEPHAGIGQFLVAAEACVAPNRRRRPWPKSIPDLSAMQQVEAFLL